MKCRPSLTIICVLGAVSALSVSCAYADPTSNANLSIRLGRPLVVRGPEAYEIDTMFSEIQTPSGFNGFTANGGTFLLNIAAGAPWAAGGAPIALSETNGANWYIQAAPGASAPRTTSSFNSCGNWINGVLPQTGQTGGNVWGFVHTEGNAAPSTSTACPNPDTTSFSIASSTNYGQTWGPLQQVISGMATATNKGEGDCTVVDGNDNNYYLYCLRRNDWRTIVARAPKSNPTGPWTKYYQGTWSTPGLGGNADALDTLTPAGSTTPLSNGILGTSAGYMTGLNQIALFGVNDSVCPTCINGEYRNSLKMSLASDKVTFYPIVEPIVPLDPPTDSLTATGTGQNWPTGANAPGYGNWATNSNGTRVSQNELYAYPSVMNYTNANNQLLNGFLLTHMYIEPGDSFNTRHLVFRDVTVTASSTPVVPQVGIALSRWVNASVNDSWTTTAPVPCNAPATYSPTSAGYCTHGAYSYDKFLGYLMTQPHPTLPTNKIEDCVNEVNNAPANAFPGHLDHMLSPDQTCVSAKYIRLRTAGWVYQSQQPNTVPLYRCWNTSISQHFVSNDSACEAKGNMEFLMGYALAN